MTGNCQNKEVNSIVVGYLLCSRNSSRFMFSLNLLCSMGIDGSRQERKVSKSKNLRS